MDTDRIIFSQSIPTLQKLAAHAKVLPIWQEYLLGSAHFKPDKYIFFEDILRTTLDLCEKYWDENDDLIKNLQTPSSIENILITSSRSIRNETSSWIYSFKEVVFAESLKKYFYRIRRIDVKNCCWTHDLKIDYVKTISKLLSTAELSEMQKFIVYCKYCMTNEITNFPRRSLRWNTLKVLRTDTLLNYWICQLKNETFTIPSSYVSQFEFAFGHSNISIDVGMAIYCFDNDDFGFEYFWNRLGANDQVTVASEILPISDGAHQIRILSRMSMLQQQQLICKIPGPILKNFILFPDMWRNAVLCWEKTKDLIEEQRFYALISEFFNWGRDEFGSESERNEKCDDFLLYIWKTAPDRLRNHILEMSIHLIVGEFFRQYHSHTASGFRFLRRLISMKSAEYRRQLILDNAVSFVTNVPVVEPRLTIDLLELCLPDENDRLEFQKLVSASDAVGKHYKGLLIHRGDIDKMKVMFNIFSSNIVDVHNFKKRILQFNTRTQITDYGRSYLICFNKWKELNEFINEAFVDDAPSGLSFKKKLLFAFAEESNFYWPYPDRMNEFINVVEYALPSNDVETFKQIALNKLREKILLSSCSNWGLFERNSFFKNVLWCLGDEAKAQEFVTSVPERLWK